MQPAQEKDPLNNPQVMALFTGEKIAEWGAIPHKIVNDRLLQVSVSQSSFDLQQEPLIANLIRQATGLETKFIPVNSTEYSARLQEFLFVRQQDGATVIIDGGGLNTGAGLGSNEIKEIIIKAQGQQDESTHERW